MCLKCKSNSLTFDPFWDLSLPMPRAKVSQHTSSLPNSATVCRPCYVVQVAMCASLFMYMLINALDDDRKTPLVQVAEGQDHLGHY